MIQNETYDFNNAFQHMVNSKLFLESIKNSGKVAFRAKHLINKMINRIEANISDITFLIPEAHAKVLQEQMLDSDVTLQSKAINDMLAELPQAKRDEIESYVQLQYKIYKQSA